MDHQTRQPYIAPDIASRRAKADKIVRVLGLHARATPWRVLEVGTGTGGIAHFLATHPEVPCEVTSVDVVDLRKVSEAYAFKLVHGTALPFDDAAFDIVITNHVIEHVGDAEDQLAHLRECRRVMAADGRGYLACPNRWMLVEPHFHLAFLSWLPRSLADRYVRLAGKGARYDCAPPTMPQLERLFGNAGLQAINMGVPALRATFAIEGTRTTIHKLAARIPDAVWHRLAVWMPTLIYRFRRSPST